MHDSKNAISVQNLIAEIASLLRNMVAKDEDLNASNGQHESWLDMWATAFWETICREWASIDQWRMNKVLLLVRLYLRETFQLILSTSSDDQSDNKDKSKDLADRQVQILQNWPLSPRERKVPDGLRLHVLDIWSDELVTQLKAAQKEQDVDDKTIEDVAKSLMVPVEKISKDALSKGVRMRAKETLKSFDEQLST
jgi:ribosomal RNA-processing protein 1